MKKKLSLIIALALVFTAVFSTGIAGAADTTEAPEVRVNALMVEFPDAQPFVDSNSRTLIPVRFVSEALGANVTWEQSTSTAVIAQDGITVRVPIGSDTISVAKNGSTTSVKMDTAALVKQERTYVPIRFVAEALGSYVDYSNEFNTVQIYRDALTMDNTSANTISSLRKMPYTVSELEKRNGYNAAKAKDPSDVGYYFGTHRESFYDTQYGFANAAEQWLREDGKATDNFKTTEQSVTWRNDRGPIANALVAEACANLSQKYAEYEMGFMSSSALLYQGEGYNASTAVVRGILVVKANENFTSTLSEKTIKKCGFGGLTAGSVTAYIIDAHMVCWGGTWQVQEVVNICQTPIR